jgi:hypothetical protein
MFTLIVWKIAIQWYNLFDNFNAGKMKFLFIVIMTYPVEFSTAEKQNVFLTSLFAGDHVTFILQSVVDTLYRLPLVIPRGEIVLISDILE